MGAYITAILQTVSIILAIVVLHRTFFKNEDKED